VAPCDGCTLDDLSPKLDDLNAGRPSDCDNEADRTDPSKCHLGAPADATTVALFGDSHAGNWSAAIDKIGQAQGWQMLNFVSGGCPSVTATTYSYQLKRPHTECDAFRSQGLARLGQEKPKLVIIANAYLYDLVDSSNKVITGVRPRPDAWLALWKQGLETTVQQVQATGAKVMILGDTPPWLEANLDPVVCLDQNATAIASCTAPASGVLVKEVIAIEKGVADAAGVPFVDVSPWFCADQCPAAIDHFVVYMDAEGHITGPMSSSLAGALLQAIQAAM
jgi:hypothetical protein